MLSLMENQIFGWSKRLNKSLHDNIVDHFIIIIFIFIHLKKRVISYFQIISFDDENDFTFCFWGESLFDYKVLVLETILCNFFYTWKVTFGLLDYKVFELVTILAIRFSGYKKILAIYFKV